jgi:hypothetical protein
MLGRSNKGKVRWRLTDHLGHFLMIEGPAGWALEKSTQVVVIQRKDVEPAIDLVE